MKKFLVLNVLFFLVIFTFFLSNNVSAYGGAIVNGTEYYCPYENQTLTDDGHCKCNSGYVMSNNGECHVPDITADFSNDLLNTNSTSYCSYPVQSCTQSQYDSYKKDADNIAYSINAAARGYGYLSSAAPSQSYNDLLLKMNLCQIQINSYPSKLNAYNSCIKNQQESLPTQNIDISRDQSCNDNYALNSVRDKTTDKCICKSGYILNLNSTNDKLSCLTSQEIQDAPQDPLLKRGINDAEKLYPDAGLTGLEKSSKEVNTKIIKSNSYLVYQKTKQLSANQIIENINKIAGYTGNSWQDMENYVENLSKYQTIPKLVTKKYPAHSVSKFAKIIISNHPTGFDIDKYKNMDSTTLAKLFIGWYPAFKDRVLFKN